MLRHGEGRGERASRKLWRRRGDGTDRHGASVTPLEGPEAVTIAIASGKGGTGKSFIASSLAILSVDDAAGARFDPSATRRRVGLVDCDFGLACAHLLLGVRPERTLNHVVGGSSSIGEVSVETEFGVALVPGGSGVQRMADLGRYELATLGRELGDFVRDQDAVFFDVGAGISRQTLLPVSVVDHVVLVTQPEIAALTDAYALIKCMAPQCQRSPFSVVVNRVAEPGQGDATYRKLAEVARRFTGVELHYLGEVLDDPAVTQRRLGQAPLVVSDPTCQTSMTLRRIHDRLGAILGSFGARRRPIERGFGVRFRAILEQLG